MYVARMHLNLGDRKVAPGDEVPEAESWAITALRAHLRLGWLEKVEEPTPATPTPPKKSSKKKKPPKEQ